LIRSLITRDWINIALMATKVNLFHKTILFSCLFLLIFKNIKLFGTLADKTNKTKIMGVLNMQSERTPAPRTPLCLEVSFKISYARNKLSGTLKNISLGGAFLEFSGSDIALNDKINVMFIVGSRERKITAQVIWKNNLGVGIKFLPLNNRDIQIVDDLIYYVESKRLGHRGILDGILKKVA